jgi:hypothetical protein
MWLEAAQMHAATGPHSWWGQRLVCIAASPSHPICIYGCRWVQQLRAAGLPQAMPLHEAMGFPSPTQA